MLDEKDDELTSIIEGFKIFASDNGGLINPNELKEIMEIMNMAEKNPFLYNIINNFCTDPKTRQKGGIKAEDFISQIDQELQDDSTLGGIQKLFSVFYNPLTYTVPITAFSQASMNIGEEENENYLKNLINKSNLVDKELDFNEFRDIMQSETPKKDKENIVYRKKIYSEGRDSSHNHNKKSNKHNNINNNINNNNYFDSMNSLEEKNSEMYNNINKKPLIIYDNNKYNINEEIKFEY
jgi:Ca2+-binding EF-hand superfamily protein